MDRALSLFRIFDIAFFAPGAVIFAAVYQVGWFSWKGGDSLTTSTAGSILALLLGLGLVYMIGLVTHGIQRMTLHKWVGKPSEEDRAKDSWFLKLKPERVEELRLYFWYLRATCLNLVVALLIAAVIFFWSSPLKPSGLWVAVIVLVVSEIALLSLGRDFNRAMVAGTAQGQLEGDASP
jgi:hypothetical protein